MICVAGFCLLSTGDAVHLVAEQSQIVLTRSILQAGRCSRGPEDCW